MFWIALAAAQISAAPSEAGVRSLFSFEDVPLALIADGEWRRVGARVTVDPTGKIQSCQAESSSGDVKLDAYTCQIIDQRARFKSQIAPDSGPIFRVVRTNIVWSVNAEPPPDPGDLQITVANLPEGSRDPAFVSMTLLINESGHPTKCIGEEPRLSRTSKSAPALLQVACDQLVKSYIARPAVDGSGKAVRSVQNALVRFSLDRRK